MGPGNSLRYTFTTPFTRTVHKTTYAPIIYTSMCVIIFDAGRSITWAIGKGLGPGYLKFFGPQMEMALTYRLDAISQGPKLSISRVQPPPICPRNVSACIKKLRTGPYKS